MSTHAPVLRPVAGLFPISSRDGSVHGAFAQSELSSYCFSRQPRLTQRADLLRVFGGDFCFWVACASKERSSVPNLVLSVFNSCPVPQIFSTSVEPIAVKVPNLLSFWFVTQEGSSNQSVYCHGVRAAILAKPYVWIASAGLCVWLDDLTDSCAAPCRCSAHLAVA